MFQLKYTETAGDKVNIIFKYIYMFQLKLRIFILVKEVFTIQIHLYVSVKDYITNYHKLLVLIQIHLYVSVKAKLNASEIIRLLFKYIYMFQLKN